MCGICGFVSEKGIDFDKARDIVGKMSQTLIHRGPDEFGFHYDENAALGMSRLRIIDLTSGSQPFYNSDKTKCVIFNGEIYNFRELRDELKEDGCYFSSTADTEVIVYLYEKYGLSFVNHLNGMFAIALWDKNEKQLILVRDRLGIKPLYYCCRNSTIYFASELFPFKFVPNIDLTISPESIDSYLAYRSVPAPKTIYRYVYKLMPAEMLIFKHGDINRKLYWKLRFRPDNNRKHDDFIEEFIDRLKGAVKLQSFSDAPLGCFLSGGLDSSLITAFAVLGGLNDLKTFSMRPGSGYFDESRYSKLIADEYQTNHIVFNMPDSYRDEIENIIRSFDEPFAHHTMIPTYFLARGAKQYVDAVLSGEGSDEIFAGYGRYQTELMAKNVRKQPMVVKESIKYLLKLVKPIIPIESQFRNKIDRAIKKMAIINDDEDMRFVKHFQIFSLLDREELLSADFFNDHQLSDYIYLDRMRQENGYFAKRYAIDIGTWLHDQMLTKVDRMTMVHSLEARVPFLDHTLVEFSTTIPDELKFSIRTTKKIIRDAARRYLPAIVVERPKHGFAVPLDPMFRGELKEFLFDTIDRGKRKYLFFDYEFIGSLIDQHINRKENYGIQLFSIVSLLCWLDN